MEKIKRNEKMEIIVTFYITKNFKHMIEHWTKNAPLKKFGVYGTKKPIGRQVNLGGLIIRLDWSNKRIAASKKISCPSGFDFKNNLIYVASMRENKIYVLKKELKIIDQINNKYFNDIHSVNITKNGLLITSSGLDLILEISPKGKVLWEWWAFNNGYNTTPLGKERKIKKNINSREIDFPTLEQTTHINSAIFSDDREKELIASLFHQGEVVRINKSSGKAKTILNGLKQPHSVYRLGENFVVSDTNGKRVIIFNKNGKIINEIFGEFNWIQDCTKLSNGNYLVADSNNNRIVEVNNKGRVIDFYNYDKNYKIYQIKEIVRYKNGYNT